MEQYFKVSFQYSESVYCTNIAHAESVEDVKAEYSKYTWFDVSPASTYNVEDAKRRGMPIIECKPIPTVEEVKEEPKPATETKKPVHFENVTLQEVREAIEHRKNRSAWNRGVKEYALELCETLKESIEGGYICDIDHMTPVMLENALLNGAKDWQHPNDLYRHWVVFSWGGSALIYDPDIAKRLCTPSELKRTNNGERRPNSREEWLDVQARALYQAARLILSVAAEMEG